MANVLEFTLGLEVSGFLHACGLGEGGILSLAGAGDGLKKVMEKVWGSIEQAGALEHLSRRTGESAGNLFRLEEGFKAAGVGADGVGSTLFMMQKALGGVNEMGEDTSSIFARLGLSIADLKKKGGAGAFQDIIASLSRLNQSSATKAASGIFGRMGAASAVQLSRGGKEFAEAMQEAGQQAAIFDRMAAASGLIERTILGIKRQVTGLFAGIAEGAIPGIQAALDMLKKIDLTSIGEKIGKVIGAVGEAIASGEFVDLLKETFQAGWEFVGNYGVKIFNGVVEAMATRFQQFLTGLPAAFGVTFQAIGALMVLNLGTKLAVFLGMMGDALKAVGMDKLAGKAFGAASSVASASADKGVNANADLKSSLAKSLGEMPGQAKEIMDSFKSGFTGTENVFGTASGDKLQEHMASLMARVKPLMAGETAGGGEDVPFGAGLSHKTEGNVFEKMGFVSGGAGGPAQDTARNTAATVDLLTQMRDQDRAFWDSHAGNNYDPGVNANL